MDATPAGTGPGGKPGSDEAMAEPGGASFDVPATAQGVRRALDMLAGAGRRLGLGEAATDDLRIVAGEVLNNICEHAYAGRTAGRIAVVLSGAEGGVHLSVRDRGTPMPGLTLPDGRAADLDVALDDLPEGGFGWFMIRSLARDIAYRRIEEENRLDLWIASESG